MTTPFKDIVLMVSLAMNVVYFRAYNARLRKHEALSEKYLSLGYRVNTLLMEKDLEPDEIIVGLLRDLGMRTEES